MKNLRLIFATIIGCLVVGCTQVKTEEPKEKPVKYSNPLTLKYKGMDNEGTELKSGEMAFENIIGCISGYCKLTYGKNDSYTNGDWKRDRSAIGNHVCRADFFLDLVTSPKKVSLVDAYGGDGWDGLLIGHDECSLVQNPEEAKDVAGVREIVFDPVSKRELARALKKQSIAEYYLAIDNFLSLVGSPEKRILMYNQDAGSADDGKFNSGIELAEIMYTSLPTLVNKTVDLKTELAEGYLAEGVVKGEQWGADEWGQWPALSELFYGFDTCKDDEVPVFNGTVCISKCAEGTEWVDGRCAGDTTVFSERSEAESICVSKGKHLLSKSEMQGYLFYGVSCHEPYSDYLDCTDCSINPNCEQFTSNGNPVGHYWLSGSYVGLVETGVISHEMHPVPLDIAAAAAVCARSTEIHTIPKLSSALDISKLPKNSVSMQRAMSLIAENEIDFEYFAMNPSEIQKIGNVVLSRVNDKRVKQGINRYHSVSDVVSQAGTNLESLKQAARYMNAHARVYPRKIERIGDPSEDARLIIDNSKQARLPVAYFTGQLYDYKIPFKASDEATRLMFGVNAGLVHVMADLRDKMLGVWKPMGEDVSKLELEEERVRKAESMAVTAFQDTRRIIEEVLGKKRITYKLTRESSTNVLSLTLINPTKKEQEIGDPPPIDQIAVYPVGGHKGFNQFANMVCFHNLHDGCDGFWFYKISKYDKCRRVYDDCAPCEEKDTDCSCAQVEGDLSDDEHCEQGAVEKCTIEIKTIDEQKRYHVNCEPTGFGHMELDKVNTQWLVEMRTIEETSTFEIGNHWSAVGMINNDLTGLGDKSGALFFEGSAAAAAQKIASFDTDDISNSFCSQINGLDKVCIDKNWVPAIENEVNDSNGNQYEDSYKNYLNLAKIAAQKAADVRSLLINDTIEIAKEEDVQKAQLEEAITLYEESIREICGDQFKPDFEESVKYAQENLPREDFEAYISCTLEEVYGCALGAADGEVDKDDEVRVDCKSEYNQVAKIPDVERIGPLHCSEPRDCSTESNVTRLSSLGVLFSQLDIQDLPAGMGTQQIEAMTKWSELIGVVLEGDIDMAEYPVNIWENGNVPNIHNEEEFVNWYYNSQVGFSYPELGGDTSSVLLRNKLDRIYLKAKKERAEMMFVIGAEPVYNIPRLFKSNAPMAQITGGYETQDGNNLSTGFGEYSVTLNKIANQIEEIRSLASGYLSQFDTAMALVQATKLNIKQGIDESEAQIADKMFSALISEAGYADELESSAMACVEKVLLDFDDDEMYGRISVEQALVRLEEGLTKEKQRTSHTGFNDPRRFRDECDDAVYSSGADKVLNGDGDNLCDYLDLVAWEDWGDDGNRQKCWYYRCNGKYCYFGPIMHSDIGECKTNPIEEPSVHYKCPKKAESIAESIKGGKVFLKEWYHTINNWPWNNCKEGGGGYFHVASGRISKLAKGFIDSLKEEKLTEQCSSEIRGCAVEYHSIPDRVTVKNCHGSASRLHNMGVSKWSENGEFAREAKDLQLLKAKYQETTLEQQLIQTGQNIESTRSSLSSAIRNLHILIGQLSSLEQKQVSKFNEFLDRVNVATGSKYINNDEWNERYDFRREEYKELQNRARIAAWVARRAIEFRFGIDLSRETSTTIYGDTPSQWADDIYESYIPKCTMNTDADSANEKTTISSCLTPEERIELYVQKLEDYVASYGNNPGQEWWFHEDNDMGVISMRDHLTTVAGRCEDFVGNFLSFSEEFEMTTEQMENVYSDDVTSTVTPTPWKNYNVNVIADDEDLGNPFEVLASHYTSEYGLFEDQAENLTADRIISAVPANALDAYNMSVQQSIPVARMLDIVEDFSHLDFSTYVRKASNVTYSEKGIPYCDYDAGERFFKAFGSCALPCTVEDPKVPQGTCAAGQICMTAGNYVDEKRAETKDASMCNWCTADRGCIHQNGSVVGLGIAHDESGRTVEINANAYPYWTRQSVNSHSLAAESGRAYDTDSGNISVFLKAAVTKNLVKYSEDLTREDVWNYTHNHSKNPTVISAPDGSVLPNTMGSGGGDSGASYANVESEILPSPVRSSYTGSLWIRGADGIEPVEQELKLTLKDDSSSSIKEKKIAITVTEEWKRYELSIVVPKNFDGTRNPVLAMRFDTGYSFGTYGVWGAQIEEGINATVYVPTGKNILADSLDLQRYHLGPAGSSSDFTVAEEYGHMGVRGGKIWRLRDFDDAITSYVYRYLGVEDVLAGSSSAQFTLSMWARRTPGSELNSTPVTTQIALWGSLPGSNSSGGEEGRLKTVLTDQWERVSTTLTTTRDIDQLRFTIVPAVLASGNASIDVWGIQLEKGPNVTGYHMTQTGVADGEMHWPLDVGVSGAQLTPLNSHSCDSSGKPIMDMENCVSVKEAARRECCAELGQWYDSPIYDDYGALYEACITCGSKTAPHNCGHEQFDVCNPYVLCSTDNGYTDVPQDTSVVAETCLSDTLGYVRNTYLLTHTNPSCEVEKMTNEPHPLPEELDVYISQDARQALFKGKWQYVNGSNEQPGYHMYSFNLNMDAIEKGTVGNFGMLAPNNFNYRMRTVAVNVVGTDVIDCSNSETPSTCAANNWVSYDLKQMGDVRIRNHHKEYNLRPFHIPTGRVSGGKAWVAEQVIGFPISGAHQTAMSQLQKVSLMGRPLQGTFELRLYDVPNLAWTNVEDIQLLLGYHYWTRSE